LLIAGISRGRKRKEGRKEGKKEKGSEEGKGVRSLLISFPEAG